MGDRKQPDEALRSAAPALWAALSPLGRRLRMPANFLPQQTAEARGKRFNATIGQITDGHGRAVPLPTVAAALAGLPEAERSRALLYSPVEGLPELRQTWRARQRRDQPEDRPSSLPLATGGVVHALSLVAQLFAREDRTVVLPATPPADYPEIFGLRTGARLVPLVRDPCSATAPLAAAFRAERDKDPMLVVLRLPATADAPPIAPEERADLLEVLAMGAQRRPVVALVDDTWERLEPGASGSLFWDLIGLHPALVPLKVDGADGRLGFPGGRIGFLTLPFPPDSVVARELESKVKLLLRAEIGSPSAASQMVLLAALAAEG